MNHEQAIQEMATERYLLDELSPELREAFEEHLFDCPECALDLRAGNVFMNEAKSQLPAMTAPSKSVAERTAEKKPWWSVFVMPAFAAPVFAALMALVVFQNVSTIPALRSAATQPRIIAPSSLHADTRGAEATLVQADRKQGAAVLIDLPQGYSSYQIALNDPQGKQVWTKSVAAPDAGTLALSIPGMGLKEGSYTLSLAGIAPQGARTMLGRRVLDIHLTD
jgi:hypothetical protein